MIKRKWILGLTSIVAIGIIALSTLLLPGVRVKTTAGTLSLSINKAQAADTIPIEIFGSHKPQSIDGKGNIINEFYTLTVNMDGMPGFRVTNKQQTIDVYIKEGRVDSRSVALTPADVTPIIKDNTVTWRDLYTDIDVILICFDNHVNMSRLIKTSTAPKEFDVTITNIGKGGWLVSALSSGVDNDGNIVPMVEKAIVDGRTETLSTYALDPVTKEVTAIAYPVLDAIDLTLEYATTAAGTRTNTTVNKPTNTADGDFLLAGIYSEGGYVTAPAGWEEIVRHDYASAVYFQIFYKRASSEGASWTWTHSSAYTAGWVKRFTGVVATGDPEDCTLSTNQGSGSETATSITTNTAGAAVIMASANYETGARVSASTLTERIDMTDLWLGADIQATAGATGNKSATISGDLWIAVLLALKPASGATPPSLSNTPTSIDLGALWMERSYYAKGTAPSNPIVSGDCTFTITNDGSITCNITASMTDMTGGTAWNLVSSSPSADEFRLTAYYVGQNPASGLVLTNAAQAFYNGLAASANISWDFKYETGTWSDTTGKTGTLTLTAITP